MKKILVCLMLAVMLSACARGMNVNGKYEDPQGVFTDRNPKVQYKVSVGNVVWGVILFETIIAPVIIFGWYLWEPVGAK